ncbi:hypothetical protein LIER_31228 [Lithospermum erythrorhizon]|uniref:Uncharacterized protein n=1 Tax=Lithospermum erythrorhizon TaxID=34254 RepID=A0AAV3RQ81_LITER
MKFVAHVDHFSSLYFVSRQYSLHQPASLLSEKLMGSLSIVAMGDKAYTERRAYLLLAFDMSPSPTIPPEMVSTLHVIFGDASILPPCLCLRSCLGDNSYGLRGDPL